MMYYRVVRRDVKKLHLTDAGEERNLIRVLSILGLHT